MLQKLYRMYGSAIASVFMRGISVLLSFAITFWIGRYLGPAANGKYALVTQTAMLLAAFAVGGIDVAVVKEYARAKVAGNAIALSSFARLMLGSAALAGVFILALALGGRPFLAFLTKGTVAANGVIVLIILLMSRALMRVTGGLLRSQGAYVLGQTVDAVIIPLLTFAFLILFAAGGIEAVLWCTAAAGIVSALVGLSTSARYISRHPAATSIPFATVLRTAVPLWAIVLITSLADWYGLATVSATQGIAEAGIFRVALQIGIGLQIILAGISAVFSAKMSESFNRDSLAEVGQFGRAATMLTVVLIVPAAAILLLIAEPLLNFIGPEFVAGATVLRIIVIGQVLIAITGPSGWTLVMAGHGRAQMYINLGWTIFLLISAPIASHVWGISGVALAVAVTLVGSNLFSLLAVRRLVGINIMTGRLLSPSG